MAFDYEEVQHTFKTKVNFRCDSCGAKLKKVYEEGRIDNQLEDALVLQLEGGYGMFFDGSDVEVDLCKSCANSLIDTFPFLRELIANAEY